MTVKKLISIVIILFGMVALIALAMGRYSQHLPEPDMLNGKLRACPDKPNCVCSENYGQKSRNRIPPLSISEEGRQLVWTRLIATIKANGGEIRQQTATYLHATFTSSLLRFVDDVEFRLDTEHHQLHARSASRVGYSDFGVNRKRIEKIRDAFEKR